MPCTEPNVDGSRICVMDAQIKQYDDVAQVVCTLGPKSRSVEMLEELLRAGMAVARFNFSHGSYDYHQVQC